MFHEFWIHYDAIHFDLTDYCREEFGKLGYFNLKSAEIGQFSCAIRDFSGEKGRFGCLIRSQLLGNNWLNVAR